MARSDVPPMNYNGIATQAVHFRPDCFSIYRVLTEMAPFAESNIALYFRRSAYMSVGIQQDMRRLAFSKTFGVAWLTQRLDGRGEKSIQTG